MLLCFSVVNKKAFSTSFISPKIFIHKNNDEQQFQLYLKLKKTSV